MTELLTLPPLAPEATVPELPPLRPPIITEAVDPTTIAPDPGPMGQMYIGARKKHKDGMTLAIANPRDNLTYEEIKERYAMQREEAQALAGDEFDSDDFDVAFFDGHFETVAPATGDYKARPGENADAYTRRIRPLFIYSKDKQGHFGVKLPYDRSVAGIGRFAEHSFLWDGYHMAKGYRADGEWGKVLNIVDNTEHEVARFGHPLNGSADFYVTRPQPDYFAHMVRMLASPEAYGDEALIRYLPTLERNHMGYWMDGMEELAAKPLGEVHTHRALVRLADGTFVNRYWDDGEGPRLESYKEDVEEAELAVAGIEDEEEREQAKQVFYRHKRIGATTGWDYTSRLYKDGKDPLTINSGDLALVDLQSLMAYNEETLALSCEAAARKGGYYDHYIERFYTADECMERATMYRGMLDRRVAAINKYNWDPVAKIYRDYNFAEGYQTKIVSAAMVYPLYVGIANAEQTDGVADAMENPEEPLLYKAGIIATTTEDCDTQWDGGKPGGKRSKNVWAPFNWAGARGFARMGHKILAFVRESEEQDRSVDPARLERLRAIGQRALAMSVKVKGAFMYGVEEVLDEHGMVTEKHRGDNPRELAGGGEYELVGVLAMAAETYRAMMHLDPYNADDHLTKDAYVLAA